MGRGDVYIGLRWKLPERPGLRWEDNIKMDFQEVVWGGGIDWINLAQDRDRWRALVKKVIKFWVP
jgi:hypothetical protein